MTLVGQIRIVMRMFIISRNGQVFSYVWLHRTAIILCWITDNAYGFGFDKRYFRIIMQPEFNVENLSASDSVPRYRYTIHLNRISCLFALWISDYCLKMPIMMHCTTIRILFSLFSVIYQENFLVDQYCYI